MQKRLLDVAAEQTHAVAESYREGKAWKVGGSVAELARRGIEGFVETEKVPRPGRPRGHDRQQGGKEGRRPARNQLKILTRLAREGVEKYIDVQQKLLDLAIDQLEFTGQATAERIEAVRKEVRTSWRELTPRSIRNFIVAHKSLLDLAAKPLTVSATKEHPKNFLRSVRGKKQQSERAKLPERAQPFLAGL